MKKPLIIKLRQGDEVVAAAPFRTNLLSDRMVVITKKGHLYDLIQDVGTGNLTLSEVWQEGPAPAKAEETAQGSAELSEFDVD